MMSLLATWIDNLSSFILIGLAAAFVIQMFTSKSYWSRFWRRLSRPFDPLRRRHWLLPGLAAVAALIVSDAILAFLGTGYLSLWLWFVCAAYGVYTWVDTQVLGRFQARRLRKHVAGGMGMPNSMSAHNGVGLLDRIGKSLSLLPYSILLLGATRSGKTEAAKHIVRQQLLRFGDGVMVVFDYKRDYQDFFDALGIDYIRLSLRDSTHVPNIFREFDDEMAIDEFARGMFPDGGGRRDGGSAEHFDDVARQTFAAILKMLWRDRDDPDNATVRQYFLASDPEAIFEDLSAHDDLVAARSSMNVETNAKHAQNTYITLQKQVKEVFVGDFARSPADGEQAFSFREAYESPPGKPIVLDFPKNKGDSTKPLFRFYLDWAARFALDNSQRQDYFILDEFARIPNLRKIGDLLNVGAGDRVQVVCALQSVNQMYANYGRDRGNALLSGLVSKILLRANDSDTVEFIRDSIGTEFQEYTKHVEKTDHGHVKRRETKEEEEHRFSKGQIRKWQPGVGAIVLPDRWAKGYMPQLDSSLSTLYERAILGDTQPPVVEEVGGGASAPAPVEDDERAGTDAHATNDGESTHPADD